MDERVNAKLEHQRIAYAKKGLCAALAAAALMGIVEAAEEGEKLILSCQVTDYGKNRGRGLR
jgi:hypothetical protein